jgi:hypothetical protein
MKYTLFGFSQQLMVEQNVNLSDAVVLRFIVDFYHTGKMKKIFISGREYIWINYQYVSDNLPILHVGYKSTNNRANKKRVTDCIESLSSAGVLEKHLQKDAQGTFVYVRIVEEMYDRYLGGGTTTAVTGYHHSGNPVTTTAVTKDTSIKDTSIKDSKTPIIPNQKNNSIEYPEWLNTKLFDGFLQDRKDRKQPATPMAIKGLISALEKACNGNPYFQAQIIEKSITNAWKSFFPLKPDEIIPEPSPEIKCLPYSEVTMIAADHNTPAVIISDNIERVIREAKEEREKKDYIPF